MKIAPDGLNYRLKLPVKIYGHAYIYDLAVEGCPICNRKLSAEGSVGFGSLHCAEHGIVWHWIASKREKEGYTSRAWKNHITGERSREWRKRFPE